MGVRTWASALVLVALCACAEKPPIHAESPLDRDLAQLQSLSDPDFNGGLRVADAVLADRLATESLVAMGAAPKACGKANPMAGQRIGALDMDKKVDLNGLLEKLPIPLQTITRMALDGTPAQQAVALRSLAKMGTAAAAAVDVLNLKPGYNSAWLVEAMSAMSCERWGGDNIENTVPEAKRPAAKGPACEANRLDWLLAAATDPTRVFPANFFEDASPDSDDPCWSRDKNIPMVDPALLARLPPVLLDPSTDPNVIKAVLDMLATLGPQLSGITPNLLPLMASGDPDLAWKAERVVVSSAIPQAVPVFRHWLQDEHLFNWAWRDYVKGLAPYQDQVVPLLVTELKDPIFDNRTAAATGLGDLQSPDSITALIGAIDSRDWQTTEAAVNALAPFVDRLEVKRALALVATDYWAGRTRTIAALVLKTGKPVNDPFACSKDQKDCPQLIQIGGGPMENHAKKCRDGKLDSGRYRTNTGHTLNIKWIETSRTNPPRGTIKDLSNWCASVGNTASLRVPGGWLAGCSGFEAEGMLYFIPTAVDQPPVKVAHMGVEFLVRRGAHIYVIGEEPFSFGFAGALYEAHGDDAGNWDLKATAALPSFVAAYYPVGDGFAVKDQENSVLFEPDTGISLLTCEQ